MSAPSYGSTLHSAGPAARAGLDHAAAMPPAGRRVQTARPGCRLTTTHAPHDPRAEQIRALRTELLLRRAPEEESNVVALLSPCAGEGRSQLAAELAIAFAQLGRPTLLVDADLRHPQQHVLLGVDNRTGLSQAIALGEAPELHAVEALPQMFVVTAGAIPANPLELLLHERFARMFEAWRRNFEFVVVDTPPVQSFSDALAVAGLAGRVLALTRAHHTPYQDTRDMLHRLAATRARVLGSVISKY